MRSADGAVDWTWRDHADRVDAAAAGLHGVGVRRGDTVALWLSNRPEFHVADMAAARLGAAPFSVGLGLPLFEVYGMSETTGVATVNAPGAVRVGTVGRALPSVESRSPSGARS